MILRDIYKELGEIFDFKYEKNSNGSVRVNTVIAHLVYPRFTRAVPPRGVTT